MATDRCRWSTRSWAGSWSSSRRSPGRGWGRAAGGRARAPSDRPQRAASSVAPDRQGAGAGRLLNTSHLIIIVV